MGRIRWAAIAAAACTLALAAVAVALLAGRNQDRAALSRPPAVAASEPDAPARDGVAVEHPLTRTPTLAPDEDAHEDAAETPIPGGSDRESAVRRAVAREPAAAPADPTDPLGWRQGTWWTVAARQYDAHSPQGGWVSAEYVFDVVRASRAGYVIQVRFADHESQPEAARGVQVEAGYAERDGWLRLAWVRPLGRGPKLSPEDAAMLMGRNALPLEPPAGTRPGWRAEPVRSAALGEVRAATVDLDGGATGTYAAGAPWWVSYSRGADMTMELTGFGRAGGER